MKERKYVFGVNGVGEALRREGCVSRVFVAKESRAHAVGSLIELAREQGIVIDFAPQAKLNELAGSREHQGVVAAVSPVAYVSLDSIAADDPSTVVVLDQVQHSKNLGMVLRTALGAGVAGVVLPSRGSALLDEEVVRSSAGAVFHVPVAMVNNVAQALRTLKDRSYWIYGLDGAGEADLFEIKWPDRVVVVMGNESEGLRPAVKKSCDYLVRIPLSGGLESLNVAVAAGVALFQVARARTAQ